MVVTYAQRVRVALQEQRRLGFDFETAWLRAMKACPPPNELWTERLDGECSPLDTLHDAMADAYGAPKTEPSSGMELLAALRGE